MGCLTTKAHGLDLNTEMYAKDYNSLALICQPINFLDYGSDELFVGKIFKQDIIFDFK